MVALFPLAKVGRISPIIAHFSLDVDLFMRTYIVMRKSRSGTSDRSDSSGTGKYFRRPECSLGETVARLVSAASIGEGRSSSSDSEKALKRQVLCSHVDAIALARRNSIL